MFLIRQINAICGIVERLKVDLRPGLKQIPVKGGIALREKDEMGCE
jgi:hypothetical protein